MIHSSVLKKLLHLFLLLTSVWLVVSCQKEPEAVPKSTEKQITKFGFRQFTPVISAFIDQPVSQISATVPSTADLTRLVPSIEVSAKAKVAPDSGRIQDFTKPVTYTVTAEDGTTAQYVVSVTRSKSDENQILIFSFEEFTPVVRASIDQSSRIIRVTLPATADMTKLKPVLTLSPGAKASPASGEVQNFTGQVEYVVTAENGSQRKYVVLAYQEPLVSINKSGRLPGKPVIYVSNSGGFELKAVDALTGTELWSHYNNGAASFTNPTIYDGNLLFNSYGLKFLDCTTGAVNGLIDNTKLSDSSPVVLNDVLYYGSGADGFLRAVDLKTKKMKWSAYADYWVNSSPVILKNTIVISIQNGNALMAFDLETGVKKWEESNMRGHSNPCTFDNTVIAGSFAYLQAHDIETGVRKWRIDLGETSQSSPTVSDGIVYVGSANSAAYAINAATGALVWKTAMGNVDSSPIVAGDLVYFYSKDSYLYALDKKTGTEKWKFRIAQPSNYSSSYVNSSPVVVDGVVFIQGVDRVLYALNALTGVTNWQYNTAGYQSYSSPCVVDKNGRVYHSGMSGMTN